ncbi:uncharacterized protein PHALS_11498 [Plasmopara halstedii]|uniref:Uncharacterized protein n=1 Tax=Plasmopara halstedii TaxID=4781 RepID=A0A0N7L3E2_PLAHL|nr:uncharacterized protein PHALS_11498 [Plasmopara halstedii]CEG35627.1 hypothetical protein PHALS_11498 [Plasmopara halstedii]|eukprot:XP_024571996.1 hypothetical protein PHALS_11498 [Plasmopara halstedii]
MNFIVEDSEEVDYESELSFPAWEDEEDEMRLRYDVSPARTLRTPFPFPDLSTSGDFGIATSCLDEAQEQQLEDAHRAALMRSYPHSVLDPHVEYGFRSADLATEAKDTITSLGVYVVGPPATTHADLDKRKNLRARFSVP